MPEEKQHSLESWRRIALTNEEKAILADERCKAAEQRVEQGEKKYKILENEYRRLKQWYDHWRGVFLEMMVLAAPADFDEGYARRIKSGR